MTLGLGLVAALLSVPAAANSYFSGEIMLGTANQKTGLEDIFETSDDDISLGLRGAYALNQFVAFELAYQDYGQTNDTYIDSFDDTINDRANTKAFNAGVKGMFPFGTGYAVHARAGVSIWDFELRKTDSFFPGEVFKFSDSGTDLYIGIGGQMDIGERFFLGLEYTVTDMDVSVDVEGTSASVNLDHEVKNLTITFGMKF